MFFCLSINYVLCPQMTLGGKKGEGMQLLYTNQPYPPLIYYYLLIHKLVWNALVFFPPHRTVMNRGGRWVLIIFTLTQGATFQTPIFNILNGLTGITRRSINGCAKRSIYPHSVPNFTLYLKCCLTRVRIAQLRCLGALGW